EHVKQGLNFDQIFSVVSERYMQIANHLGAACDMKAHLRQVYNNLTDKNSRHDPPDYAASRGEYLNALIIADVLGAEFVDAGEIIFFDRRNRLDEEKTYSAVKNRLKNVRRAVIPGFYGTGFDGKVKTFSRGGS